MNGSTSTRVGAVTKSAWSADRPMSWGAKATPRSEPRTGAVVGVRVRGVGIGGGEAVSESAIGAAAASTAVAASETAAEAAASFTSTFSHGV